MECNYIYYCIYLFQAESQGHAHNESITQDYLDSVLQDAPRATPVDPDKITLNEAMLIVSICYIIYIKNNIYFVFNNFNFVIYYSM